MIPPFWQAVGVAGLILMTAGWYCKLTFEGDHMDAIGYGTSAFVLGCLFMWSMT